jgi:hypothetical protein
VQSEPVRFVDFTNIAAHMTSFLLPILAIMLVIGEWSQRSAPITFTLGPRRSRVVLAKLGNNGRTFSSVLLSGGRSTTLLSDTPAHADPRCRCAGSL